MRKTSDLMGQVLTSGREMYGNFGEAADYLRIQTAKNYAATLERETMNDSWNTIDEKDFVAVIQQRMALIPLLGELRTAHDDKGNCGEMYYAEAVYPIVKKILALFPKPETP